MSLATREQLAVMTDFAGDGAFRSFGRQKNMKERLEENVSEQLRLRTAVDYQNEKRPIIRYKQRNQDKTLKKQSSNLVNLFLNII